MKKRSVSSNNKGTTEVVLMSKNGDIKKQIKAAIEAVKDFDEPYRTKAFEVILSKFMEKLPSERVVKDATKGEKPPHHEERIKRFAEAANLSVEQLENVFEFNKESLRFIAPLTDSVPQKQITFTHCILTGLEQVYGKKSIKATELAGMLDDYGLSTANLARGLQSRSDIFRKVGKKRETRYKLTDVGKNSAIELVRTLAT